MPFTGKATYSAGATLPEIVEDLSDLVGLAAAQETPLLDALGDSTRVARSTVHEWLEDAPRPTGVSALSAVSATVFTVSDATALAVGDVIQLGDTAEMALVTAVSTGDARVTLARGYGGTPTSAYGDWSTMTVVSSPALEGGDARAARFTNRVRVSNTTQIFSATVEVSGTQQAVSLAGVRDEIDYQKTLRLRELTRDLERAIIQGVAPTAHVEGNATTARSMRGILSYLTTNVLAPDDLVAGATSLTEAVLNAALRSVWERGIGTPDLIVVNGREKRHINEFLASNRRFAPSEESFRNLVSVYESDYGVCRVVLSRHVPVGKALLLDSSRVAVVPLAGRSFHYKALAATGDREAGQIIGEYTLELRNEAAHGVIDGLAA
ncbi:MAG: DUF5309 family protein [Tepidisphaeraceae bacterium]